MIWSDKVGKGLFKEPYMDMLRGNKLPDLFEKVKNSGDDRSRTILVNLILEHLSDVLLGCLIKNYEDFTKDTKPSFYLKLSLLKSFDLIPEQVLTSVDCLREIRNKFAHKLEITSFTDLDDKTIAKINKSAKGALFESEELPPTIEGRIAKIEFHSIVGLDIYEPNLRLLSEKINSKEFKDHLESEYKMKLREQTRLLDEYLKSRKENE